MSDSNPLTTPGDTFLIARRLSPSEAALMHEELKTTPNILGYTIPELLQFSDVLVAEVEAEGQGRQFAGVCISKDLLFGWTDIAVLYVLPTFRGRGLGKQLFTAAFVAAQARQRHIYTLSRSPETIRVMERLGMELTRSVWKAPFAVHLHMNQHMMSLYRMREGKRKIPMRQGDGNSFVGGTKRFPSP